MQPHSASRAIAGPKSELPIEDPLFGERMTEETQTVETAQAAPAQAAALPQAPADDRRGRGRPRRYVNQAARQKAWRDRRARNVNGETCSGENNENGHPAKTARERIQKLIAERNALEDENAVLRAKLREADEKRAADQKAAAEAEFERRLLAFRALCDLADQTGVRGRFRDWDAVIKAAENFLPTGILEEVLAFPTAKRYAPDEIYWICKDPTLLKELAKLPMQYAIRWLIRFDQQFQSNLAAAQFLPIANSLDGYEHEGG